jgi:hypothetical protein
MKNLLSNLFHIIGIIFFLFIIWLLLELTGAAGAFRETMNAARHATGH